jgi:hypothetical protein
LGDGDDAARLQPLIERFRRAVVGGRRDARTQHSSPRARPRREVRRLRILDVRADIADVRKGEGDDLAGVGGIGQNLLIARHGRIEAHLADRGADRAEPAARDDRTISEHKTGRRWRASPGIGRRGLAGSAHGITYDFRARRRASCI